MKVVYVLSRHEVEKNGIVYIIPDDELYQKYVNDEAFIDEYGRLINRKPHRVLKELKHFTYDVSKEDIAVDYSYETSSPPWGIDFLWETARELWNDEEFRANVKTLYHLKIKPACRKMWKTITGKSKTKASQIVAKSKLVKETQLTCDTLTNNDIDKIEKDLVYHWFCVLADLAQLKNAGAIDEEYQKWIFEQLSNPIAIEQANRFLEKNLQILQLHNSNLTGVLNRELVQNGQFIPISIDEVRTAVGLVNELDIKENL